MKTIKHVILSICLLMLFTSSVMAETDVNSSGVINLNDGRIIDPVDTNYIGTYIDSNDLFNLSGELSDLQKNYHLKAIAVLNGEGCYFDNDGNANLYITSNSYLEIPTYKQILEAIPLVREHAYDTGYEAGYLDGLEMGMQDGKGTISYNYHYHEDGLGNTPHTTSVTANSGGCYTSAVKHGHVSSCYTVCKGVLVSAGSEEYCDRCDYCKQCPGGCENDDGTCKTRYFGRCNSCGRQTSYSSYSKWNSAKGSTCGVSTLVCVKTTSTIDYWNVACGLLDGQILSAEIVF